MTALVWDEVGDRKFETGVNKCILFLSDGTGVAWNGITSIEEQSSQESQPYFLDGVKYMERQLPGDFSAVLRAFTYPDEFDSVQGVQTVLDGLSYHNQQPQTFSLVYQTRIGNDVAGVDYGYKIHVLYNLVAIPDSIGHQTIAQTPEPIEFGWTIRGVPKLIDGYRPTVHISFDSTEADPRLAAIETLLYGNETSDPSLPDIDTLTTIYDTYNDLTIIDNEDGTWTAIDLGGVFITMIDETTFSIDGADVEYLDPDTYTIENTDLDD